MCMQTSKTIDLRSNRGEIVNSEFIARFSVDENSNLWAAARVKLEKPFDPNLNLPLNLYLISDDDWEQVLHSGDCTMASKLYKFNIPLTIRGDGEWSNWVSAEQQNVPSVQVWYAVASDCAKVTHASYPEMPKIVVELHMKNSGSEFSHEDKGITTLYIILFFVYVYYLASTTFAIVKMALNKDDIEVPVMCCVFAIYMELLHIITQSIHLYIYSQNGSGFFLLDLASTVLQMNSQIIIVGMLIMIAYGWLITDTDISQNTTLMGLGVVVCLVQSCATFLTVIDDGAHHKYHDYGGWQGMILVVMRIILYVIFMVGVCRHLGKLKKKPNDFLKAMSVAGTLYMITFPILWFLSFVVAAQYRNRLIVFGNLIVQLFAIVILLNQLAKKGTKFHEASEDSRDIFPKKR